MARETPRWRTATLQLLKVGISVGLLVWLFRQVDAARLWAAVRSASWSWLGVAALLYFAMLVVSSWRWNRLLRAQGIVMRLRTLIGSFLVATFFNNFLPSNIGGDVIRIADTARPARSRTLATTVVLVDRGLGLLGLVLLAAVAASAVDAAGASPIAPALLWAGLGGAGLAAGLVLAAPARVIALLGPLRRLNPGWVGARLDSLSEVLARFAHAPVAIAACFAGAVVVQAILVAFYAAIARAIGVEVSLWHMAVLVPVSFLVQMVPVSVNGFGVREATFSFYFARLGLPIEAALVISLLGAGLVMLFSLTGAVVYVTRGS